MSFRTVMCSSAGNDGVVIWPPAGGNLFLNATLKLGQPNIVSGSMSIASSADAFSVNFIRGTITATRTFSFPDASAVLVGDTATQTLTNKTLTAPKFADLGFIADANGNEMVIFDTVTSAVNEVTVSNAATGNGPTIAATGSNTDIDLNIRGKGAGRVKLLESEVTDLTVTGDLTFNTVGGDAPIADGSHSLSGATNIITKNGVITDIS